MDTNVAKRPKKDYKRFKYTNDVLIMALEAVKSGKLSLNRASKNFNIPKATLHNKIKSKEPCRRQMGPKPILLIDEETKFKDWIIKKARLGFPMHPNEIKDSVQSYLKEIKRENPFKDSRPGDKWLRLFLKRKPNISEKNPDIISKARTSVTEEFIRKWFSELNDYLKDENCVNILEDGSRIFNADEICLGTCPKTDLIIGPKKYKNMHEIPCGQENECVTVLCNISACGVAAPPMIVYPYKRIPRDVANSLPDDWGIGRSDLGCMISATFHEYVTKIFHPWLLTKKIVFPILFFLDGQKSHISMELYDFCVEKKIMLYCLMPNASHFFHPCDKSIFKPIKIKWKEIVKTQKQKTGQEITKQNFGPLFRQIFESVKSDTIINEFKACGLFPFDPNAIIYEHFLSEKRDIFKTNPTLNLSDYISTMRVIEYEIDPGLLVKFNESRNLRLSENDQLYSLWMKCKDMAEGNLEITDFLELELNQTGCGIPNNESSITHEIPSCDVPIKK